MVRLEGIEPSCLVKSTFWHFLCISRPIYSVAVQTIQNESSSGSSDSVKFVSYANELAKVKASVSQYFNQPITLTPQGLLLLRLNPNECFVCWEPYDLRIG